MRHCNIALTGFMGTGKSTVGRLVADQLGWRFIDTDAVIEQRAGRTITDIFAQDGEAAFRQCEAQVCAEIVAGCHRVIALGGGALLDPQTHALVAANSLIICLDAGIDALLDRIGDDPARPLFSADRDRLSALYAQRAAHYAGLPHHVDTSAITPVRAVEEVLILWQQHR